MEFDSYLLPLGEEFDNNMSPRCWEFEKFNFAFFIMRPENKSKNVWSAAVLVGNSTEFFFCTCFSGDFSTFFFTFW
jgi:hypothetical protein